MVDKIAGSARETGRTPLDERVAADKRQFLRLVLASMAAYSVPLMASFSMEGIRIGTAEAGNFQPFNPPGLLGSNQEPRGRPFQFGNQPPGQPFASNQTPPGRPFLP